MSVTVNEERKGIEVNWDPGDHEGKVVIYATGEQDDVHNTHELVNDGLALVSFPKNFHGSAYIEVRTLDGEVLASGDIRV